MNAKVSWLVNNNLELTSELDYSIVEPAPPFGLGNNNNLELHSFILSIVQLWLLEIYYKIITIALIL